MENEQIPIPAEQNSDHLPGGWERKRLKEVISELESGASLNSYDRIIESGEIGVLKVSAVSGCRFNPLEHKTIIPTETHLARVKPKKGSIIISRSNTPELVGHNAYIDKDYTHLYLPDKLWQTVIRRGAPVDIVWLSQVLASKEMLQRIGVAATGSSNSMKNISKETFLAFDVAFPPLPEQRKIAAILSTWDEAIQTARQLLAAKQTRKRALMQQLLTGQTRLPGFSEPWREVKLGEVFRRVNRRNDEGNTNVLTISARHGLISQTEFFNKSVASEEVRNYFLIKRGEFAYNKSTSAGYDYGAIKRLDLYDKGILSPLYICFGLAEGDSDFYAHFLEAGLINHGIYKIAQEGARNHGLLNIGVNDFFQIRFSVPAHDEQRAIAEVLTTATVEIRLAAAEVELLQKQKRGLMQQLLTGKRRVKTDS